MSAESAVLNQLCWWVLLPLLPRGWLRLLLMGGVGKVEEDGKGEGGNNRCIRCRRGLRRRRACRERAGRSPPTTG